MSRQKLLRLGTTTAATNRANPSAVPHKAPLPAFVVFCAAVVVGVAVVVVFVLFCFVCLATLGVPVVA